MKKARKLITFILAAVMIMSMSLNVWAANITIIGGATDSTYAAYKLLNATDVGDGKYIYTVNPTYADILAEVTGKVNEKEIIAYIEAFGDNSEGIREFAKGIYAKIKKEEIPDVPVSKVNPESQIIFENVESGYYLIAETKIGSENNDTYSLVMLNTAGSKDIEIATKEASPTLTKEITADSNEIDGDIATDKLSNNLGIGSKVQFTLTANIPANANVYDYYYCIFSDNLSGGLTFINGEGNELVVEATGGKNPEYKLYDGENPDEVTTYAGGNTFQVALLNATELAGQTVTVTYWAELNENAVLENNTGNTNTANLEYSNDPNTQYGDYKNSETPGKPDPDPDPDPEGNPIPEIPTGVTPNQITKTYTTGIKLIKTDEEGNSLDGAEFQITADEGAMVIVLVSGDTFVQDPNGDYYKLANGSYTTEEPDGEDDPEYMQPLETYVRTEITRVEKSTDVKAFVDEDGFLYFEGLGEGKYTITETTVPAGYNPIGEIIVDIEWDEEDSTWTVKANGDILSSGENSDANIFELTVVNQSGTELPSTGGIGTTIFYVVGGILVLIAVVLLVTKKRMKAEE